MRDYKDWDVMEHPEAIDYINKTVNAGIPLEIKREREDVVFVRLDRKLGLRVPK